MNVKRNAKRLLALMLAAVMMIGLLPMGVLAASTDEPVAVVVAASDFQQNAGHETSDSVMEGIISAMTDAGVKSVDGAIFCGDYSNAYTAAESNTGMGYVYGNYNTTWGLDYEDIIFVQGNHDPIETSNLDPSGANDPKSGAYGVFVLNEDDYSWYGGDESGVKTLAANLKVYLDEKIEDKFDAPIFVASHLPLHYSMRTYRDGDCRYAQYLFDVLNDAAGNGLNIIYLYGHNHSQSFENYHGGGAVFYSAGDEILIGDTTSNKTHHTETIQFTYMNAGYTGRFDSTDTADPTNTGTVFEIYENEVVIRRFDANGVHNLKSAGTSSKAYSEEESLYSPNTRVETSPQTIPLSQFVPAVTVRDNATGIEVTAPGLTGLTVKTNEVEIPERYSAYVSYDIEPAGYTQGNKATVVIPVDTSVFDASRRVQILDQGTVTYADIVGGKVTFTTNHFSTYDIAQLDATAADWVEIPQDAETIFRLVDTMENDGSVYLIANSNAAGDAKIVNHTGEGVGGASSLEAIDAVIAMDAKGMYIDTPVQTAQWKYASDTFLYCVGDETIYLRASESNGGFITTRTGSYENGAKWVYSSENGLNATRDNGAVYYVYYSNGFKVTTNAPVDARVYVYKQEMLPVASEYAALTGTTSFEVATGAYADRAAVIALVKQNITVLVSEDAAGSGAAETENYEISGTVDPSAEGTYTLKVSYNGVELGTVSVRVKNKEISKVEVDPMTGSVVKKSNADAITGSVLTVTYADGTTLEVPVTVGMLSGDELDLRTAGTYTGLTVNYEGHTVNGYTLDVLNALGNNYPEYPNEGAVKVGKTGTGIDFQSSGIAQVEISASGVPANKGADVIVMLDTSSSMDADLSDGSKDRLTALKDSLNVLIKQLQQKREDGSNPDIRVAVTDFNGYNMNGAENSAYHRNHEVDKIGPSTTGSSGINAHIFTNVNGTAYANQVASAATLNATAFQDINTIDLVNNNPFDDEIQLRSGTNYDYAFDAIYQLGEAVLAQNAENGEERGLYVIFMSDGGPFQYNYFSGNSSGYTEEDGDWNDWLNGTYASAADVPGSGVHKYFYNGPGNSHRMADAIKGDPSQMFDVIRKDADPDTYVDVTGDGAADEYMVQVPGLGATMYSIGFCIVDDVNLQSETIENVLKSIGSDPDKYYYSVDSGESLDGAFASIGSEIAYAAYNARFVDQMGDDYNLQMKTSTYTVVDGDTTTKTLPPVIEILTYDIYTKAEADAGSIPTGKNIGDRKGTSTLNEVVKFSEDGTKAYSNLIDVNGDGTFGVTVSNGTYTISDTDDNILGADGVIYAKTFLYNTNATEVAVEGVSIPTGTKSDGTTTGSTNVLPSETFYWKLGTVQISELAMRYYVYLEGSMEGTREGGSYPTNEYATLYYDNYLGNPCKKDTVSPIMPWKEANVSYAFYLVDENGNIIVNQTTGQTGSFANKIAVTNPVVYETVLLNTDEEVSSIDIKSLGVLPEGYELYDTDGTNGAVYTVQINSNTTGSWTITTTKDVHTTYVTQYDPNDASAYSNDLTNSTVGDDYTHTTVWFAVLWKVQALPDAVVIDYGLPVDISVLTNDMFGENGKLAGVGAYSNSVNLDGHDPALASGFGTSYTGTYGVAKTDAATGKVRYTLNTSNGMQMQTYEKFAYAVNYTGNKNAGYYYDTVTVIPATTIYYEDDFLTYTATGTEWVDEGTAVAGATQDEDRPGQYSLTDANNIYGYDNVNLNMSQFSLSTAKKVHVGPLADGTASYATATFTFYGTGFDIISMTSNTTGVLAVKVTAAEDIMVDGAVKYAKDAKVKSTVVDTYYGYNYGLYNVTYTYNATSGTWTSVVGSEITTEGATEVKTDVPENPADGATYTNQEYLWVCEPGVTKAMYQVPVLQANDLPYGKYNVLLTATYMAAMDDTTDEGYDLYLDAIRIYDPANDGAADDSTDTTIEDAYKADGEGWPSYIELRNKIIAANSFDNVANDALTTDMEGLVFIDGDLSVGDAQIADYISYGPNNEVYLAPGQRVAFLLSTPENVKNVHIGIKSADGNVGTYTITNIAQASNSETGVKAGDYYNAQTNTISTTTDMYYDLTGWKGDIIVISNTGDKYNTTGVISLTNIKSTYTSDPADGGVENASEEEVTAQSTETYVYMTPAAAALTLRSLNSAAEEEVPGETEPETTVPEETEPEITVPEETEPETTVPEETEPETTVPEETEPETTVPEETEPEATEPEKESGSGGFWGWIGKLIGWIFG